MFAGVAESVLGVFYQHTVAKNLTIRPEYLVSESKTGATKTSDGTVYLRIQRDF